MKTNTIPLQMLLAGVLGLAGFTAPLAAHETPNMDHTHAFRQTGYGTWRQGHSVNNQLGSVTIWSAKPYSGYENPPPVRFARPEPIRQAPTLPQIGPARKAAQPARDYGKPKRD
jgi:hypothetical protein